MKAKINFDKAPILKVLNSEDETSRKSFGLYDEEPTMLMSAYNRQSFGKSNLKLFGKYQNQLSHRAQAKLVTCESNLMESSPQRSQSSGFDGEFVCKYLTPIKKQQFNELLFKDQINQQADNDRNASRKSLDNKKTHKVGQRKQQNIEQNASFTKDRVQILQYSNMIKSFKPCSSIHEINEISTSLKTNQSNMKIQNSPLINSGPSAFVDINAQVSFLKSNNNELYQKLMKYIENNKALEDKVKKIENLNQQLVQQNKDKQSQINYFKKIIIKYEQQKKKYLQKEWEQFHFVKELLNQKRKSKSKNKKHIEFIKPQINIIQTEKINLYEKCPNEKLHNQMHNSKQLTQIKKDNNQSDSDAKRCFSSGKISPLCQGTKKVKSECDKKVEKTQKKRRLSFENLSAAKRLPSQNKENQQIKKILFDKLLVEKQASSLNKMSLLQQKKRSAVQNSSAKQQKRSQSRIDKQKN